MEILSKDPDPLKEIIQTVIQELLEAEMIEAIGATKSERTELRLENYNNLHHYLTATRTAYELKTVSIVMII